MECPDTIGPASGFPRSEAPLLRLLSKLTLYAPLTPELHLPFQKVCSLLTPKARPWEGLVASRLPECISECTCCPQTFLFKLSKYPLPTPSQAQIRD